MLTAFSCPRGGKSKAIGNIIGEAQQSAWLKGDRICPPSAPHIGVCVKTGSPDCKLDFIELMCCTAVPSKRKLIRKLRIT